MQASADKPFADRVLGWDSRWLCGHAGIDREHQVFADDLDRLLRADDATLALALDRLAEHLEAHFQLEERLIEQHRLPAGACHVEEHNKVRASVREVQVLVAEGDLDIGRELAQALADWFPGHADTMDASLATWVARRTQDAVPLVFRRDLMSAFQAAG